jgi:hypothetical protein
VSFVETIRQRAAARVRRIALPEADDPRTLEAAGALVAAKVVEPVLVGTPRAGMPCEVIDPRAGGLADEVAAELFGLRRSKGMTEADAAVHARSSLIVADALVRWGRVDGCVAGAVHTTGDVLRAALWLVGPAAGVSGSARGCAGGTGGSVAASNRGGGAGKSLDSIGAGEKNSASASSGGNGSGAATEVSYSRSTAAIRATTASARRRSSRLNRAPPCFSCSSSTPASREPS